MQTRSSALQPGPDLVVTEISAPRSVRTGDAFTADVKVCNQGSDPATTYYNWPWLELYLSTDTSLSMPGGGTPPPTDQQLVGSVDVPPLDPGQCVIRSVNAYASLPPDAQGEGAYHLGAIVDAFQALTEADETNNAYVSGLMGVGYRSDLVVTEVKGPASVRPGDAFTATVTVCNQGTEYTYNPPSVELYLSMDDSLTPMPPPPGTPMPTDQRPIGIVNLPPLSAGQCVTRSANVNAYPPPDAQGDGAYYLGAIVDPSQSEQELREDNNAHVSGLMGVGYRADLVVTQVSGPASAQHGEPFTSTVTVCNQGTESSYNSSIVELYLSMDGDLTPMPPGAPMPTDQRMIGQVSMPPLGAGQCVTQSAQVSAWLPQDAQGDGAYFLGAIVDPYSSELELREDNNAHVSGLMGVGYRSDLVVTRVSGPANVRPGDAFTATVTVCNQGTVSNGGYSNPHVELYLSTDTTLTAPSMSGPGAPMPGDQRMIGSVQLPTLSAGQCVTRSVNAYAQTPPVSGGSDGAFYLGAIVDPYQSEQELREDNNAFVGGLMGVGNRADLVVTAVTAPVSVRGGDSFTAKVTVCNQGTEYTYNPPQVALYLSMDTTLTAPVMSGPGMPMPTDQRMIGAVNLPPLSAGQCVTQSASFNAYLPPDAQGDGAYYLGAIVDAFQSEQELREDNNAFISGLMGVGNRSDLVVTKLSGPASVGPGDAFTATVTVCNQGTERAYEQPFVELYLSMDTTLTGPLMPGPGMPMPTDQRPIGAVQLPSLNVGQCLSRDVNVTANMPPDATGGGSFYLGAIVDPYQSVQELREDNNAFISGLMGVGNRSDLVVTKLSGPVSVRPGDAFTATVTVCNQGTTTTYSQSQVELYLSMDTTLTAPVMSGPGMPMPTDQRPIGIVSLPPLSVGQCVTRSANVNAYLPPDAQGDGAYYLGAIVDAYQAEQELREDNNTFISGLMGVGTSSDLVVTELSGPASVRGGDSFTATVTVCNQGTSATFNQPQVELYLSMDATLTAPVMSGPGMPMPTDQRPIGVVSLPTLSEGQCVTRSTNVNANLPPDAQGDGAYYLGAIVDAYQSEYELREDNNSTVGGLMGVGYRADLVVTELSGPASVRGGDPFTATVTVCNQGTEYTYNPPQVALYLSMDTTLTAPVMSGPGMPMPTDQAPIGVLSLPSLNAGQCVTQDVNVNANLPPDAQGDGAYYLGAIVDAFQSEQELREDNNSTVGGQVGVGYRSDLVVTEVGGPVSVRPGDAFTATVKVCNQGTEPGSMYGNTQVELYLSMDATLTLPGPGPMPMDQRMVGAVQVGPLAPGQCETLPVQATAHPPPGAQGDGAYYLAAIVDAYQSEQELREDNNVFVSGLMGVGNRADLVVKQLSAPATVREGDTFTATVEVCNQGTEYSYNQPYMALYISMDTTLTPPGPGPMPMDQQPVGSVQVSPLAAGQCVTLSVQAPAYRPPAAPNVGSFYLGAIVDAYQSEHELREDNNARADFALELTW
ncbi:CARDB domain-containing protein [Myxococcus sp. RHSTA-1-4]|uniref:CARDB domain-containing protein n=1 Tax=Myxococcus sp. RHSTA-1-4 TaxID=2874601 RepID=UPI001CBE3A52|nr:hypothetical protein [Myxococcus sp. RHSTA-1-4]